MKPALMQASLPIKNNIIQNETCINASFITY